MSLRLRLDGIPVKIDIGDVYENVSRRSRFGQNWAKKSGTLSEELSALRYFRRHINCNTSAVCEWNGIRLLGSLRRYKHYANAPEYCIIRTGTLSLLLMLNLAVRVVASGLRRSNLRKRVLLSQILVTYSTEYTINDVCISVRINHGLTNNGINHDLTNNGINHGLTKNGINHDLQRMA